MVGAKVWRHPRFATALLFALLSLAIGFLAFSSAGHDDAYITYWVAKALIEGQGIVNYNGENLEQSSSLLHVLVLALAGLVVPGDWKTISIVQSAAFSAITIYLMVLIYDDLGGKIRWIPAALLAVIPWYNYWLLGGLETTVASAALLLYLWTFLRLLKSGTSGGLWPACLLVATFLLAIARPESIFVMLGFLAFMIGVQILSRHLNRPIIRSKDGAFPKTMTIALAALAISTAGILGARYLHSGMVFPIPVYAKASGLSLAKVAAGWSHVVDVTTTPIYLLIFVLAVIGVARAIWRGEVWRAGVYGVVGLFLADLSFILFAGGDWMEGARFFVPILPLLAIGAGLLLERIRLPFRGASVAAVLLLCLVATLGFAVKHSWGIAGPALFRHYRDALEIDPRYGTLGRLEVANRLYLRDAHALFFAKDLVHTLLRSRDRLVLASGQAGIAPFYLKAEFGERLHFIDMRGLSTKHAHDCAFSDPVGRSAYGIDYDYADVLENMAALTRDCGFERPAIILDIHMTPELREAMGRHGYRVVYRQRGQIHSPWNSGKPMPVHFFVAVDETIAPDDPVPLEFEWPGSPPRP